MDLPAPLSCFSRGFALPTSSSEQRNLRMRKSMSSIKTGPAMAGPAGVGATALYLEISLIQFSCFSVYVAVDKIVFCLESVTSEMPGSPIFGDAGYKAMKVQY